LGMLGFSGTSGAAVSSSVSCRGTSLGYPRSMPSNLLATMGALAPWPSG
jgi:hypothetical protein